MSYDLSFYKKKTSSITKHEISDYLTKLVNSEEPNENEWFYENKETGSYCSFSYYEPDPNVEYETEDFDGFESTNFSFNINFVRPQFFGEECFPLVEKLALDLDLYILNPQMDGVPSKPENGAMFKNWNDANSRFAEMQFSRMGLKYLEHSKSDYAFRYSLKRNQLQDSLGDNYFVPGIFYLKKHGSDTIETFSIWPEGCPYILPKVDFIFMKRFVSENEEQGLVRYETIIRKFGTYFEKADENLVIHPEKSELIEKELASMIYETDLEQYGEWIAKGDFVNVKGK
ncbi:MAG: hypothetical protein K0S32_2626 [Bacteroidetes bacterium]|jgi:hypothetical protein|nr:hypothetical protein [Bacteroidota bacterium]